MKRKGITLAWVLLYIGIAVALQFVMSFMMLGIIYKIALTEGLTNSGAVAKLMELGLGISAGADEISANGAFTMVLTGLCDFIMFIGFGLWYYFREINIRSGRITARHLHGPIHWRSWASLSLDNLPSI